MRGLVRGYSIHTHAHIHPHHTFSVTVARVAMSHACVCLTRVLYACLTHMIHRAHTPCAVFLFNPNGRALAAEPITLGANLGIDCTVSGASATIKEVYPQPNRTLAAKVACGGVWTPPIMAGKSALVVEVSFTPPSPPQGTDTAAAGAASSAVLVGVEGEATYNADSGVLALTRIRGEQGSIRDVQVHLEPRLLGRVPPLAVTLNGAKLHDADVHLQQPSVATSMTTEDQPGSIIVSLRLRFGTTGPPFGPSQEVSGHWKHDGGSSGSSFSGSFAVPSWVFTQLTARNKTYPIDWNQNDLSASWLSPGRLLLGLEAAASATPSAGLPRVGADSALAHTAVVAAKVDGVAVATQLSYNCRGLHRPDCFSGFYFDLTRVAKPGKTHSFTLSIAKAALPEGVGLGLFFDNVEQELTTQVAVAVAV